MKSQNLFWGGILVTFGTLFILRNTGVLFFSWYSLFRLWPIILVFLGITMLPLKSGIKALLSLATIAVLFAFLFTSSSRWQGDNYRWDFSDKWAETDEDYGSDIASQYFYEPYNSEIKEATLNVAAIAGDFELRTATEYLFEFNQDGNIGPYIFSSTEQSDHRNLKLKLRDGKQNFRRVINDIELKLHPDPVWNFDIESGAAKIRLDLRKFKTQDISIAGGASSVNLKVGDLYEHTSIYVQSGASSITLSIPEESGCEIITTTVLSSRNFDGFDKIDKGYYQTPNFDDARNTIKIKVDAAITSLKVRRY